MSIPDYTEADHKKAFEIWRRTRNFSEAARIVGAVWQTIKRWGEADYRCLFACPFHGWERLEAEAQLAVRKQQELVQGGVFDPVAHDRAIRDAALESLYAKASDPEHYKQVVERSARSIAERLKHWEYLWSKVFFNATGIVTDWETYRGDIPTGREGTFEDILRQRLEDGLHGTTLESCVRMLKIIQDEIEKLRGGSNLDEPRTIQAKPASIESLRQQRKALKNGGAMLLPPPPPKPDAQNTQNPQTTTPSSAQTGA